MVRASMQTEERFNLVFMDIQMPNLDGIQSTRRIRDLGFSAPIVALTAFSEESNVKECYESGMDAFIPKPIRRPALKQVLKQYATIPEEPESKEESASTVSIELDNVATVVAEEASKAPIVSSPSGPGGAREAFDQE